jgi:Ni/Co efflux regulator RcnB
VLAASRIRKTNIMKALILAIAASALVASAAGAQGFDHSGWAQDQGGAHHWQRGERMGYNDWSTAAPVDYRAHHLRHPPRGYEWRESNGQYVLGAVATGVIASMIINSGR